MLRVVVFVVVFGVSCEVGVKSEGEAVVLVHSFFPFCEFEG